MKATVVITLLALALSAAPAAAKLHLDVLNNAAEPLVVQWREPGSRSWRSRQLSEGEPMLLRNELNSRRVEFRVRPVNKLKWLSFQGDQVQPAPKRGPGVHVYRDKPSILGMFGGRVDFVLTGPDGEVDGDYVRIDPPRKPRKARPEPIGTCGVDFACPGVPLF